MIQNRIEGNVASNVSANENIRTKKSNLFEGTILEGAVIVYVAGTPIPMVAQEPNKDHKCLGDHYVNVITGEQYHLGTQAWQYAYRCEIPKTIVLPKDTKVEPLMKFLTQQEAQKIMAGQFTDQDALNFSYRIAIEAKTSASK